LAVWVLFPTLGNSRAYLCYRPLPALLPPAGLAKGRSFPAPEGLDSIENKVQSYYAFGAGYRPHCTLSTKHLIARLTRLLWG